MWQLVPRRMARMGDTIIDKPMPLTHRAARRTPLGPTPTGAGGIDGRTRGIFLLGSWVQTRES